MTQRYESLILSVPEITQDEIKTLESQVERSIKSSGGSMISFEKWGKYKLAYPVNKHDYGVYFLARFEVPQGTKAIEDLRTLFTLKFDSIVMRDMATALAEGQSLEYQRPHSLEEAPARDVRTFLKDNKMEGLLSSVDKPGKRGSKDSFVEFDVEEDDQDED